MEKGTDKPAAQRLTAEPTRVHRLLLTRPPAQEWTMQGVHPTARAPESVNEPAIPRGLSDERKRVMFVRLQSRVLSLQSKPV